MHVHCSLCPQIKFVIFFLMVYQDFFSSGVAGALRTVRDHFDNDILDLSTAISLVGEISSIDLDESNSFAIEQDTEVFPKASS